MECLENAAGLRRTGSSSWAARCQSQLQLMTNIQIKDFILAILKKAYPNNNEENHPNSLRKPKAVTNRRATRMLKELVGISIFEPLNRGHGSSATTLRRRLLTKSRRPRACQPSTPLYPRTALAIPPLWTKTGAVDVTTNVSMSI